MPLSSCNYLFIKYVHVHSQFLESTFTIFVDVTSHKREVVFVAELRHLYRVPFRLHQLGADDVTSTIESGSLDGGEKVAAFKRSNFALRIEVETELNF